MSAMLSLGSVLSLSLWILSSVAASSAPSTSSVPGGVASPVAAAATVLTWSEPVLGNANWQWATNYAASSTEGGFTDWRLPTQAELQAAIQNGTIPHTNNGTGSRWSSDTRGNRAWAVLFVVDANGDVIPSQSGQASLILKSSNIRFLMVRP